MNHHHTPRRMLQALLAAAMLTLAGCGSGTSNPDTTSSGTDSPQTGSLKVDLAFRGSTSTGRSPMGATVLAADVPTDVVSISASLTSSTGSNPSPQTVHIAQGYVEFDDLAVASDYALSVQALNASGTALCTGSASSIAVSSNQMTDVQLALTCTSSTNAGGIKADWATVLMVNGSAWNDTVAQGHYDWYIFDVAASEHVTVSVAPTGSGNPNLYVFSNSNIFTAAGQLDIKSVVGESHNSGADSFGFSASVQRYYVAVHGYSTTTYNIQVTSP